MLTPQEHQWLETQTQPVKFSPQLTRILDLLGKWGRYSPSDIQRFRDIISEQGVYQKDEFVSLVEKIDIFFHKGQYNEGDKQQILYGFVAYVEAYHDGWVLELIKDNRDYILSIIDKKRTH